MTLSFNYLPTDSVQLYFSYSPDKYSRGSNYWTRGTEKDILNLPYFDMIAK